MVKRLTFWLGAFWLISTNKAWAFSVTNVLHDLNCTLALRWNRWALVITGEFLANWASWAFSTVVLEEAWRMLHTMFW